MNKPPSSDLRLSPEHLSRVKAALAKHKTADKELPHPEPPSATTTKTGDAAPLSVITVPATPNQIGLWFLSQYQQETTSYAMLSALRLRGTLDHSILKQALRDVVSRHSALRTTLRYSNDALQQHVSPDVDRSWAYEQVNLAGDIEDSRHLETLQDYVQRFCTGAFDLGDGPLFRVLLAELSATEHVLVINTHHAISDGWSQRVLTNDLGHCYTARVAGHEPSFSAPAAQFHELTTGNSDQDDARLTDARLERWETLLAGIPDCVALPTDFNRPATQSYRGKRHTFTLNSQSFSSMHNAAQHYQTTPFAILLSAFKLLVFYLAGQDRVVVGVPVAGRVRPEHNDAIGYFANTVPISTPLALNQSGEVLVSSVHERLLLALELQETPLEKIVERLNPPRNLAWNPLFQIAFSMIPTLKKGHEFSGLHTEPFRVSLDRSRFDLTLFADVTDDTASFTVEYSTELFAETTIARWMLGFVECLDFLASFDQREFAAFQPFNAQQKQQQPTKRLHQSSLTQLSIPALFATTVVKHWDKVALRVPGPFTASGNMQSLTYAQLDAASAALAQRLLTYGNLEGQPVAICMPRGFTAVVSMLAVLRAGGAYLPLVCTEPAARLERQIKDSSAKLLLVDADNAERFVTPEISELRVSERELLTPADNAGQRPIAEPIVSNDLAACVLYTSGSTGTPKGVQIPHRAVTRLVHNASYADLGPQQVVLHMASLGFDAATFEIWGALLNGGTCVIHSPELPDPRTLRQAIESCDVTTAWITNSLFNALIDEAPACLSGLKQILTGGEALSVRHIVRAQQVLPDATLFNGYGPTENGTFTTIYPIPRGFPADSQQVPIGQPIDGTEVFILDPDRTPVTAGELGELWVGGAGVALGYLGQPEDSAFQHLPKLSPSLLYRTGDHVKELPDGNLEFAGRIDNQVKLNGFRVELDEVEQCLRALPEVQAGAVAMIKAPDGQHLAAFIVPAANEQDLSASALRAKLAASLADYKLPRTCHKVSKLPIGANGKVDKNALIAGLDATGPKVTARQIATSDSLEHRMLELWRELLNAPKLEPTGNFFEAGGNSLLAVRLMGRIQSDFGQELSLGTLFEAPSVRALVQILDSTAAHEVATQSDWSPLVPLQPDGSLPALFLVHALGGQVHGFQEFVQHLPNDQPVYGLQCYGYIHNQTPHYSLVEMAAAYGREIQRLQPKGPYFLGGLSLGGLIAHELAAYLERTGERVAFLMIGDTAFNRGAHIQPADRKLARWFRYLPPPTLIPGILRWRARRSALTTKFEKDKLERTMAREPVFAMRRELVTAAHRQALESHEPSVIKAPIVLMLADAFASGRGVLQRLTGGKSLGWNRLTSNNVRIVQLKGSHNEMFYGDNAPSFAAALQSSLAQTEELKLARLIKSEASTETGTGRETEESRGVSQVRITECSPSQRRAWFLQQLDPESITWNLTSKFHIRGPLDVDALQKALDWLVARHEPLRTNVELRGTAPVQIIHANRTAPLQHERIVWPQAGNATPDLDHPQIREAIERHAGKVFKPAHDLLLRPILLHLGTENHLLILVLHHLVTDGWSINVLKTDLSAAYLAYGSGQQPDRPALAGNYSDVIATQADASSEHDALKYWRTQLQGPLSRLALIGDGEQDSHSNAANILSTTLSPQLSKQITELALSQKCSVYAVVLAVFNALFARLSGESDMVLGMPTSGRQSSASFDLIGFFVNTLVIRNQVALDGSFTELCSQVWENLGDALTFEAVRFEQLVDELVEHRSLEEAPFFDVMINSVPSEDNAALTLEGLNVEELEREKQQSNYALTFYLQNSGDRLQIRTIYKRSSFSQAAIGSLLDQFQQLSTSLCQQPQLPLNEHSLVTEAARTALPNMDTSLTRQPFTSVGQEFMSVCASQPDAIALQEVDRFVTYEELRDNAMNWVGAIQSQSIATGQVVAVCGRRSIDYWTAALGVLLSGNVLLLLDPDTPNESASRAITLCKPATTLITDTEQPDWIEEFGCPIVDPLPREKLKNDVVLPKIAPADAAYIFFTSGSTGQPKAVLGRHDSLQQFISWERNRLSIGPQDKVAQLTVATFDVVLRDFLLPLVSGATLALPPPQATAGTRAALEWLSELKITILHTVPSILTTWLAVAGEDLMLPNLRVIVSAGEPLRGSLVASWRKRFVDSSRFINLYGCTETTLARGCYEVPEGQLPEELPVGQAIPGSQLLVCNPLGQLCGVHEKGEVIIRTTYPALGYLAAGSVENSIFDADPDANTVRYKTGDVGYYTPMGDVVVTGRKDSQLKIRGIRIHPAAVAEWVEAQETVARCVALGTDNSAQRSAALHLFVVFATNTPSASAELTEELTEELRKNLNDRAPPGYQPSTIVPLATIPSLANGKVDYLSLRAKLVDTAPITEPKQSEAPGQTSTSDDQTIRDSLQRIWSEALEHSDVSSSSNFFALGGHSLLLPVIAYQIERQLGVEISLRELYTHATLSDQSSLVYETRKLQGLQ